MTNKYELPAISTNIKEAFTLPSKFYKSQAIFDELKESVFSKFWQRAADKEEFVNEINSFPFYFLNGYINEPMLLVKGENGAFKCLSNVCTHRANLVCNAPCKADQLVCGYHGRRFDLSGEVQYMPEFEDVENYPSEKDHLFTFPIVTWGSQLFTSLDPMIEFSSLIEKMNERIGFMNIHEFKFKPSLNKEYIVEANWALYCDNYLEGFHIPFVHNDLNQTLDYGDYTTEIYDWINLQIGYSDTSEHCFDLPDDHIDYGKNVAAYYYWIFPNMMFNFYPWGLSMNIVCPIDIQKTAIKYYTYEYDPTKKARGAGGDLDKVELEDGAIIKQVQKGINSITYNSGRFSPRREQGVHHFHSLLSKLL